MSQNTTGGGPTDENQIIADRRAKLAKLRESGPAFPNDFARTHHAADLHARFGSLEREALDKEKVEVAVAGRIMLKRVMGKASFATIQDGSGRIQLFIADDEIGATTHEAFKHWDIGDIVGARGLVFRTNKGELSIRCKELRLLTKSLRPLPDKFHGLEDKESRYRQRYVDLIVNDATRTAFVTRAKAIAAMRQFMVERGFLEVETPMLQSIPGGAAAKPFITHHNALDIDMYLRIAPELFLKRLVVGGYERVFEINRNFRNEGLSPRHNPEFTMMEFYAAYQEYQWLMDFTEELLRHVAIAATGSATINYQGQTIDLASRFARMTTVEAIKRHAPRYAEPQLNDATFLHAELARLGSTHSREVG
ncbi:MAG TPA: lysine--tRNA ligase, partial [Burkholderiaceae bacterium]|nr:lysine--tRNA ligase [Burkholderiaceae bacterium]